MFGVILKLNKKENRTIITYDAALPQRLLDKQIVEASSEATNLGERSVERMIEIPTSILQ